MHIAILAPTHKSFISKFLPNFLEEELPDGYSGAPWIGSILEELLNFGYQLTVITTSIDLENTKFIGSYNYGQFTWIVVGSRKHSFRFNGNRLGRIVDFYNWEQQQMLFQIEKHKPDLIHAFWSYEFAGVAIKSKRPYLITVEDNSYEILRYYKNIYRFFRLVMSEIYLRKVDFASTPSPYMFNYVDSRCRYVKIIPNPTSIYLNIAQVKSLIKEKMLTISSPKIIMIFNGWDSRKNGYVALLAFKILLKHLPNATLNLFGSGTELFGGAYKYANRIGVTNVNFCGEVSHNKIIDALNSSHLFVHPSLEESFGVVLTEAMSFGIPCLGGVNSGAVPWVINNDKLLVDVRSPTKVAKLMLELLTNSDFYYESSFSGYLNVEDRFSVKNVVNEYVSYYKRILM